MRAVPGPGLLLARALTLATTSAAVSALAHVLAGGHGATGPMLAIWALQLAVATGVARRPLTAARVVAWATTTQLATHVALTWLHPVAGTDVTVLGHHGLQHAHATVAGPAPAGPGGGAMLAAHVLGTLLVAFLASGADRAAAAVAARWSVVLAALRTPSPLTALRPLVAPAPVRAASTRPLRHVLVRRGPPVPATV